MKEKILATVNEAFCELLGKEVLVNESTTPADVDGWDSLFQANLTGLLEAKYGLKFKLREILTWESVGDIVECIKSHM